MGGTLSAAGSAVSNALGAGTNGLKSALPRIQQATGIDANTLQQQAENILQSTTAADPASMSRPDAVQAVGAALPDLMSNEDKSGPAKQRITEIVAAQAHINPQDAQKHVEDAQARLAAATDQGVQAAKQAADASAAAASRASFMAFVGLLAGAIAAAIGGATASPRRVEMAAGRFR